MTICPTFHKRFRILKIFLITTVIPFPSLFYNIIRDYRFSRESSYTLTVLTFLFINIACYLIAKAYYKRVSYEITDEVITEKKTFLAYTFKEIKFSHINEIMIWKGPLQRLFSLGNLVILSGGTSGDGNSNSGMMLFDIPNPEEMYAFLKEKRTK